RVEPAAEAALTDVSLGADAAVIARETFLRRVLALAVVVAEVDGAGVRVVAELLVRLAVAVVVDAVAGLRRGRRPDAGLHAVRAGALAGARAELVLDHALVVGR